ncbi:hypothetical protein ACFVH9_21235, partial [Streptomyces hirsutus]
GWGGGWRRRGCSGTRHYGRGPTSRPRRHGRHVLRRPGRRPDRAQPHPGEDTFEGRVTAAAKGNHGGRPKAIDDDSLLPAHTLKDRGVPVPEIAKKLTVKTGKNAGQHLSVASV